MLTNCLKKVRFKWENEEETSFCLVKSKIVSTPILVLPNFEKIFEVKIDACLTGNWAVFMQEGKLVKFFSEKFNKAKQKWSTYELVRFMH